MVYKDPEKQRQYMKTWRENNKSKRAATNVRYVQSGWQKLYGNKPVKQNLSMTLPFAGCDGEGVTLENGYHAYNMLRMGDNFLRAPKGAKRLHSLNLLNFICDQDPDQIYVGYFFNYDVTKILEDLPIPKIERLMKRELRMRKDGGGVFAVSWNVFEIDYLPGKEFKVRRGRPKRETDGSLTREWERWVVINDVGSFFQCKFVDALRSWGVGDDSIWEPMEQMKQLRGDFTEDQFDEIAEYNRQECIHLVQLMNKFRDVCQDLHIAPKKWQGPGQLVESKLMYEGVKMTKDIPCLAKPDQGMREVLRFAQSAYYGGRFERSVYGHWYRPLWLADINSAYPAAMMSVPCLEHGRWIKSKTPAEDMDRRYALVLGSFTGRGEAPLYYGLPFRRKDKTICFPRAGRGWYWAFEVAAAKHQVFYPEVLWYYVSSCDCKPLGFVGDMFTERFKLGKTSKGMAIKLVMNSIYGKMVQSVGIPKFSNPIWGSYLTAMCRTQIMNKVHEESDCEKQGACGLDVLMIATDSIMKTSDFKTITPDKSVLGGWDVTCEESGGFVAQPGLWFPMTAFDSGEVKVKSRGIRRSVLGPEVLKLFRHQYFAYCEGKEFMFKVDQPMFYGLKVIAHTKTMKKLGQWEMLERQVVAFKDLKRGKFYDPVLTRPSDKLPWLLLSSPATGNVRHTTKPYDRSMGFQADTSFEKLVKADLPNEVPDLLWDDEGL